MREIVHLQAGQCGNQIGAKVSCFMKIWRAVKKWSSSTSSYMEAP